MKIFVNIFFSVVFCAIFFACKKDKGILGTDVQPTEDLLNSSFSDSSQIFSYTQKCDSIASLNSDAYKYLGSNQDPYFGRMDVGLYVNANLITSNVNFTRDVNLVSSEIILRVASPDYVGDDLSSLSYSVFAIDSSLSTTGGYYSNNIKLHNSNATPLGVFNGKYSVFGGQPVLRIPISYNFADAIIKDSANLVSNSVFQQKYKGFYITSAGSNLNPYNNQGVISKFDLSDTLSGFYLRYKKGTDAETSFRFNFNATTAVRFNTVKYQANQGGNLFLTKQLEGDTALGKEDLFLKGMGVTRIKVNIPFLKNYAISSTVAVNRAEVVFNVDPSFVASNGNYLPPPRLTLIPLSSTGLDTIPYDFRTTIDYGRYDGNYDETNKRYVFNIARHVQAIFNGQVKNNGFILVIANPEYSYRYAINGVIYTAYRRDNYIERVVLAGSNKGILKPKLNLSFIKYKKE